MKTFTYACGSSFKACEAPWESGMSPQAVRQATGRFVTCRCGNIARLVMEQEGPDLAAFAEEDAESRYANS